MPSTAQRQIVNPTDIINTVGYYQIDQPIFSDSDFEHLKTYLFNFLNEKIPPRHQPTAHSINPFLPKPAVADWVGAPGLLRFIEPILGPDILCTQVTMCYKPPHSPHRVALHSDSHPSALSNKLELGKILNVFLSITDMTSENGCLRFIPNFIENRPFKHRQVNKEFTFFVGEVDEPGIDKSKLVEVPMKANRLCLFHHSVLHDSLNNRTDQPRMGLSLRFAPASLPIRPSPNDQPIFLIKGQNLAGNQLIDASTMPKVGGFSWSK